MSRSDDPGGALVPIGWPTRASRLYVLDEQLRPVPAGTAGELYIAGEQLARGYLGRPAATAASFVPDPFGPPGQRMYRSGDLVRMRSDGCLEYLGRIDEQIKVNGYRVEPAEIEAALAEHPLVGQAVVRLASAPDALARRLTAFIVPAEPSGVHAVDPETLRHHTAARLPKHMVPVDYFTVPKIPLTGNGKVDLDLLTSQACTAPDLVAATTAPCERLLCDLIAQLTGATRVEVDDDFFQLGGTSVTAAQLVTLARREGVTITLGGVLKERTVRRLLAGRPSPGG
jgi:acyl-CoA synthetase (AMP-forming)/AMP-acid ligase II